MNILNKKVKIFTASMLCLALAGCNSPNTKTMETNKNTKSAVSTSSKVSSKIEEKIREENGVKFSKVDKPTESQRTIINEYRENKGYILTDSNKTLMIFAGKKSSGGYSVSVENVSISGKKLIVKINEKSPSKDEMNISALTYPFDIISFEKSIGDLEIVIEGAQGYEPLLQVR